MDELEFRSLTNRTPTVKEEVIDPYFHAIFVLVLCDSLFEELSLRGL